jgi:hypothetical protein
MRERERLELQKFMAEEARIQKQKEAAEEFKRLEAELKLNAAKLVKAQKDVTLGRKSQLYVSPEVIGIRFESQEAMEAWKNEQSRLFREQTPEYEQYRNSENIQLMFDVFNAHGIDCPDAKMLNALFERLKGDGLLTPNHVEKDVQDVPEQQEPDWSRYPRLDINSIRPPLGHFIERKDGMDGYDQQSGEWRHFSELEIDRMDSLTFKRAFSNGRVL